MENSHNGRYGPILIWPVFSKYSKNADQQSKRFLQICVWQKVSTNTNLSPCVKKGEAHKGSNLPDGYPIKELRTEANLC